MLVSGKSILAPAAEHNFAVPAFNISDYAMFTGIMDICEELKSPVIIAIHPDEMKHIGGDVMHSFLHRAHKSHVPTCFHWDHGASYEEAIWAISLGFTSVMIDASLKPYEENVEISRKVVEACRAVGVSVEAELGTIGKTDGYGETGTDDIIYTDPKVAADFVEKTGVDFLAVAIGTRHGIYPPDLKPELKLDLLDEINASVSVPLVLHGGSNNPDSEIAEACKRGINKVNISSDIKVAYHVKMREILKDPDVREPNMIQPGSVKAMQEEAAHKIELFGSADTVRYY